MRFVPPSVPRPPSPRTGSGGSPHIPQWLKEWREDRPAFVLLECGHKEDTSVRTVLIIRAMGQTKDVQIYCEPCDSFRSVDKRIDLLEYHGITAAKIPDEPLF